MTRLSCLTLLVALFSAPAHAAPRVAADIAPLHSLVASVMEGVAAPVLIVPQGASPHDLSLRPSEAEALANARILFTIGNGIMPWFSSTAEALNPNGAHIRLDTIDGLTRVPVRTSARFHHDDHDDHHGDDHDHDKHDSRDRHDGHAGHSHGADSHEAAFDPHLWLDPDNAMVWLRAIGDALAEADPANGDRYRANADRARARLADLSADIEARLIPLRGRTFIVFHDAYHAFENRFEIPAAGALALSDASRPGAARIREIQALLKTTGARCVFAEPYYPDSLVRTVTEGTEARIGTLDPLGAALTPGPDLYPALLGALADSLSECLTSP